MLSMTPSTSTTGRRVAVVTGGSRGIGRQTARRLAGDGYAVALAYLSDHDEAASAAAQAGPDALAVQADVADERAVSALFDAVEARFGGIDAVVHCAGALTKQTVADFDLDALDELHRTNIRGTFVVDQQAARRLRPGGALVNLSSSMVHIAAPTYGAYAASKGAIEALTLILARELDGRDVTVNAVAPGPTATEFFFAANDDEAVERAAGQSPLGRLGTPEDVAELIAFLVGPQGRWVNGQVVQANGGVV